MQYCFDIHEVAFDAIAAGRKRVEVRTNNSYDDVDYSQIHPGDTCEIFTAPEDGRRLVFTVDSVQHYQSARDLLEGEEIACVLSAGDVGVERGVAIIHSIDEYEMMIPQHGVWALRICDVIMLSEDE